MLALPLMVLTACEKDFAANSGSYPETDDGTVEDLSHGMMVLGKRLDNPYSTENMQEAYSSLYPTRSRDVIETTEVEEEVVEQVETKDGTVDEVEVKEEVEVTEVKSDDEEQKSDDDKKE